MHFPTSFSVQQNTTASAAQQTAGVGGAGRNTDVESAIPQAPTDLQMGSWDKFKRAVHTHNGARNAALIGQVLNCSARGAALGIAIAQMPFNWKGFVEVPLHAVATGVEIMNMMVVGHMYMTGSSTTGKEMRDANIFLTLGNATDNAFLKEYAEYINMATTTTPLAASAIFSGLIPVMETLRIPVPQAMRDVLDNNADSSIVDTIASSSRLIQRYVVTWFVEGHENAKQRERNDSGDTHETFAFASGEDGFEHVIERPDIALTIRDGAVQATIVTGNDGAGDTEETSSMTSDASEEYFDARSYLSNDESDGQASLLPTTPRTAETTV
ncbi:MAG: hypothetical protein P4M06_13215 [Pandoraea sp.]|nr:hypothetical protein [Pandoraea sp.]MDR3398503.1 hypothetical protein [Pandoraea sp.]